MPRFRKAVFGAILLSIVALYGADSDGVPVLTVCQALRDPARYGGQTVIIVGRLAGTSEGSWLDEDCGRDLTIEGRKYRTVILTAYAAWEFAPAPGKPQNFRWNKPLALAEVKKTTHLQRGAKWYAVYGRFDANLSHAATGSGETAPGGLVADWPLVDGSSLKG